MVGGLVGLKSDNEESSLCATWDLSAFHLALLNLCSLISFGYTYTLISFKLLVISRH